MRERAICQSTHGKMDKREDDGMEEVDGTNLLRSVTVFIKANFSSLLKGAPSWAKAALFSEIAQSKVFCLAEIVSPTTGSETVPLLLRRRGTGGRLSAPFASRWCSINNAIRSLILRLRRDELVVADCGVVVWVTLAATAKLEVQM